jgi:hypothetical protein
VRFCADRCYPICVASDDKFDDMTFGFDPRVLVFGPVTGGQLGPSLDTEGCRFAPSKPPAASLLRCRYVDLSSFKIKDVPLL